jgi:hypothetical protein
VLIALRRSAAAPEAPAQVEDMAVTLLRRALRRWLSAHLVLLRELPWRAGTEYADGAASCCSRSS